MQNTHDSDTAAYSRLPGHLQHGHFVLTVKHRSHCDAVRKGIPVGFLQTKIVTADDRQRQRQRHRQGNKGTHR